MSRSRPSFSIAFCGADFAGAGLGAAVASGMGSHCGGDDLHRCKRDFLRRRPWGRALPCAPSFPEFRPMRSSLLALIATAASALATSAHAAPPAQAVDGVLV